MTAGIEALVERRVRDWEQGRQRTGEALRGQRPMITVSRSYGAWGRSIGEQVAERLGLQLYDKEIVERIARDAGVMEKVVTSVDARVRDAITGQVEEAFDEGTLSFSDYLGHLARLLHTIAHQEQAVIVGRGAQFILDPERTLRVRAVAPLEVRVERVAQALKLGGREARAEVARVDAERAAFIRWHFGRDVADPEGYDVVLNTGSLEVPLCGELVERAYRQRFFGG